MTDLATLMSATATGDEKSFRLLARAVSGKSYGLACRLLNGDTALAEDAVQDMLIKLWRTAPRWKPVGSVEGYVHRLTYTSCMDILRKRKIEVELPPEHGAEETVTNGVFKKERQAHVQKLLQLLPERQRHAVILSYLQELPQAQVAETMDTSVKAVESLLIRAKRTLQDKTGREWLGHV
jgi:RNA polymerase sigma-70 factor (ECF subfamily)